MVRNNEIMFPKIPIFRPKIFFPFYHKNKQIHYYILLTTEKKMNKGLDANVALRQAWRCFPRSFDQQNKTEAKFLL